MIAAAILTISDSAAAGTREDRSGPAVRQRIEALGWTVISHQVVPDDADLIAADACRGLGRRTGIPLGLGRNHSQAEKEGAA